MGKYFKLAMFITSFIPLWVTIVLKEIISISNNSNDLYTEYISIMAIVLTNIIATLVIAISINDVKKCAYRPYRVINVKQEKGITSEFLLSYVLPLFVFDFTLLIGVIEFLIYFLVLAFLCIRNNNVYANLIFEIRKYKFYDCELQNKLEETVKPVQVMVISKENICAQVGNSIEIVNLNKPFFLMK